MKGKPLEQAIEAAHQRLQSLSQHAGDSSEAPVVLAGALEELSTALEELGVAAEELHLQNEELVATRQIVEAERGRYQALFDFAPDGYLVTNPAGIVQEANRVASALLGVQQDFIVGKPLATFVADGDRRAFRTRLTQLQDEERVQAWEFCLEPKDCPPIHAAITVAAVRDASGRLAGLRWLIRDITDRKLAEEELGRYRDQLEELVEERTAELVQTNQQLQREVIDRQRAEAELRESEAKFRTLTETTSAAVFILQDMRIQYANSAASDITGYAHGELVGLNFWELAHPDYQAVLKQRGVASQWVEQIPARYELKLLTKTGEERWVDMTAGVVQFDGRPTMVGTAFDITERHRAEQSLRQARDELERRVQERTAELAQANTTLRTEIAERMRAEETLQQSNAELQARNEELDAFAHTVAHDLKNPVGLIIGFGEILAQGYAAMSDDDRQRSVQAMVRNGRKMNDIIDNLLLLAQVRKAQVKGEPLNMEGIVGEALQRLVDMVKQYQADIRMPPEWTAALGYAPWVEEVWANYLSNALKHGGRPPCIELGAQVQSDGMVRFWVRDNGAGLTQEDQARLFTPFTRLDQVQVKGHGLGLSIVRRIVEKLGGQVGVESQVGQGSTFSFTLPGAPT